MIKLGEMTPFGTVMKTAFGTVMKTADVKKQSSAAEKIAVAPKPSVVSDFEMFLQNKDDKYSSKKGKALKHKPLSCSKSSHTKLHHSGAKVINGQSIAGGSKPTKSNWFDEHDKKVYRTEKDFSSTGIKRKLPKLKHNFSDDPELSDPPCDDEDEWDDQEDGSEEEYRPHRDWREEDSDYEGIRDDLIQIGLSMACTVHHQAGTSLTHFRYDIKTQSGASLVEVVWVPA